MSKKSNPAVRRQTIAQKAAAFIALLLALLMILSLVISAVMAAPSKVDSLKQQLSEVNKKKKDAKKELDSLRSKKSSILDEIEQIDTEITAATEEIELQEELITELDGLISIKETELADSQQKEDEQYEKLKSRVRVMYENGSMSYLSILLSSDDFSEFLSRYDIVSQLSKYDKNLFEEMKKLKEQVAEQKASLETDRGQAVELKSSMEANKAALQEKHAAQTARMKEIAAAEKEADSRYADIVKEQDRVSEEVRKAAEEAAKKGNTTYVGGKFMWPLPAANNVVTCPFGMRKHPITGKYKLHTGVDLRGTTGTKIFAANDGVVTKATHSRAYGYYVSIDHGGGYATLYAHMSRLAVKKGQKVSQGTVIGYVGSTGYSTAPHLHFEVIKGGKYTNPLDQFPNFRYIYK